MTAAKRGGSARGKALPTADIVGIVALGVGALVLVAAIIELVGGPPTLPPPRPVARLEEVCFDRQLTYGQIADIYGLEEDLMETTLRANGPDGVPARRGDPIPGEGCVLLALSPGASSALDD